MDDDPEIRNAMNFVTAIPVFASRAAMIGLVPPDVLTAGLLMGADSSGRDLLGSPPTCGSRGRTGCGTNRSIILPGGG